MEEDIASGLSAEAAVAKEQATARARLENVPDAYLRERLHDLDDLSNRLLRILTGQGSDTGAAMPENPILVARNIGPAELLEYGRKLKGVVLEEGSVGSHAAIVARALAIPMVIHAERVTTEALNGDPILAGGRLVAIDVERVHEDVGRIERAGGDPPARRLNEDVGHAIGRQRTGLYRDVAGSEIICDGLGAEHPSSDALEQPGRHDRHDAAHGRQNPGHATGHDARDKEGDQHGIGEKA
jgi:phosphohistidine swiveling domain-containing protein